MQRAISTQKERLVSGGEAYINPLSALLQYLGERYLGLSSSLGITIKTDRIQSYSSEQGLHELDDETVTKITRTGKLTVRQFSLENLKLFLAGTAGIQVQTTGTVTGESITVMPDRYYQLGTSVANPSGVRRVSAVTVAAPTTLAAWAATTVYAAGAKVKPAATPLYAYQAITAGTSGATAPTWPTIVGDVVTDGGVSWVCIGILAPVLDTDYTLDSAMARLYVLPTARVHPDYPMPWSVGYTRSAAERERLVTGALTDAYGAMRFIAKNAKGQFRDVYAPYVTFAPSGDLSLKEDSPKYAELSFELSFSKGLNGEPALIIDGRPE
jgi:hypothetical protein